MESSSNSELGYSTDHNVHFTAETPRCSTISGDSSAYSRSYSEASTVSDLIDDHNSYSSEPSPSRWPATKCGAPDQEFLRKLGMKHRKNAVDDKLHTLEAMEAELEMMKERFSKLLLGEDMSGSGKGVCTAVTISNSITNLYATIFGHNLRLEPLKPEKKTMWRREMNCLLSVCDYIVDFTPKSHHLRDGTALEIMESRPRSDLYINLPALRKLDALLIEILDSFEEREFWYAEQGSLSAHSTRSGSFRRVVVQRKEEKWWVPVPCVPSDGLSEKARKHLRRKRDSAYQIHKAAMAINSSILVDMEIPETYMESLPKSGRTSLGDTVYRYMSNADKFSPEHLLDSLNIASEHEALELADKVEASMYVWRRKACLNNSKSSWEMVKELMSETDRSDKNHVLALRAESLLFSLKQRYPELAQTSLDGSKIQYNRDVGKAVLESYSRVLEGLAFNIVAWIEDVLYIDTTVRNQH